MPYKRYSLRGIDVSDSKIAGLKVVSLALHADERGVLSEFFRADWNTDFRPRQWNLVRSAGNALRGVHLHAGHADYLLVVSGAMLVGVHDARQKSDSFGKSAMIELSGDAPQALIIPEGVAHGFYCAEPATYLYGLSACWTGSDEFGCAWDAPELGFEWPVTDPVLSERDSTAGCYKSMIAAFENAAQTAAPA